MSKPATIPPIVKDALACRGTPAKKRRRVQILSTMTKAALRVYDAECARQGLDP